MIHSIFQMATRFIKRLLLRNGLMVVDMKTHDIVPKDQYDFIPKGKNVTGPADRFLLVPKNRYRLTLLPGQQATDALGIGWLTEDNTPDGYDRLWGSASAIATYKDEGSGVRERMPREIVNSVRNAVVNAKSACDIGCGVGDLLAAINSVNPLAKLTGLDFSHAAIERTSVRFPTAELRQHIIDQTLPYADSKFDIVFCTDVLEHLLYREAVVKELVRICAPGGTIVIVVPDGDVDQFFGHVWFFNKQSLTDFLAPWEAVVDRLPDCREFIAVIHKNVLEH